MIKKRRGGKTSGVDFGGFAEKGVEALRAKKAKNADGFRERHRYAFCCALTTLASLLGFVNPVLSGFIADNIIRDFNLRGIIPTLIAMAAVKGTRIFLRSRVALELRGGNMRAPLVWLQRRISRRLWWLEPMVGNWGWVGLVINRITGGVPRQVAALITSSLTDTVNAVMSGVVYYFTRSYVLSLLTALVIPTLAVVPWFAKNTMRRLPALRSHRTFN